MADIERIEIGVVGLDARLNGILEADPLERLVPFQNTGDDCRAIFFRDVPVEPKDDGLLRFGQLRRWIFLFQPPALNVIDARRDIVVVGEIEAARHEIADAIVGNPRMHRCVRQLGKVVIEPEEEAADIGNRRRRLRGRWRSTGRRLDHAPERVMRTDFNTEHIGRRARLDDVRVARIEAVHLPIRPLEEAVGARDVGKQQLIQIDQHALALRVRLTRQGDGGNEAVGEGFGDGARLRFALAREIDLVLGNELDRIAHFVELDDVAVAHQAAVDEFLAQPAAQVPRKEERMIELVGSDFEPCLVVFLIDVEKSRRFLGVLDHVGERLLRLDCGGGQCGGSGSARGSGGCSRRMRGGWRGPLRRGRGGILRGGLRSGDRDRGGFGGLVGRQGCATGHDEGRSGGNRESKTGKTGKTRTLHQETPQKTARGTR